MNYPTEADYIATFGELIDEPTEEPTTEPTTDPVTEPTTEPTTEPSTEPATAPVAEPGTAPAAEPAAVQSAEERHRQAAERRARERAAVEAATQARVDAVYADMFRGQVNPYTGKPIASEADYRAYMQAKQTQDTNAAMQKAGIDPQMISQLVQRELQPMHQQLQAARMREAQAVAAEYNRKAETAMKQAVENIAAQYDPSVKSLEDIAAMPTAGRFNELVQKGVGLEDAFYLANKAEIDKRRAQAAYRKGADASASRSHLSPAGGAQQGKEPVTVPADVARYYREAMPDMTEAEIAADYAAYLKTLK